MNKARRTAIEAIKSKVESIKNNIESDETYDAVVQAEALRPIKAQVSDLRDEEQEYLDNMPESFQNGDKGDASQNAIDELDNAESYLYNAIDYLNDGEVNAGSITDMLDDAINALESAAD